MRSKSKGKWVTWRSEPCVLMGKGTPGRGNDTPKAPRGRCAWGSGTSRRPVWLKQRLRGSIGKRWVKEITRATHVRPRNGLWILFWTRWEAICRVLNREVVWSFEKDHSGCCTENWLQGQRGGRDPQEAVQQCRQEMGGGGGDGGAAWRLCWWTDRYHLGTLKEMHVWGGREDIKTLVLLCLKCLLDIKVQKVVGYVNLSLKERLKQELENHQLIESI